MIACNPGTTVYWDVDDTLVMWTQPTDTEGLELVEFDCNGHKSVGWVHIYHRNLLRQYALRGATNIVWSHGGSVWAKAVVQALGLEDYVFACLNKPTMYYDDLSAQTFMKKRRFIDRKTGKEKEAS